MCWNECTGLFIGAFLANVSVVNIGKLTPIFVCCFLIGGLKVQLYGIFDAFLISVLWLFVSIHQTVMVHL